MTVQQAILDAEALLPGVAAPDHEVDPRWQAIIKVGEFIEDEPEPVWEFVSRWGATEDDDLQAALSTCLLEHLLQHHFDQFIGRVEEAAHASASFARVVSRCWKFGQAEESERAARLDYLNARLAQRQRRLKRR
jgi:hypothetical protein